MIRGCAMYRLTKDPPDFFNSLAMQRIVGRKFESPEEGVRWFRDELPKSVTWQLARAKAAMRPDDATGPNLMLRFGDFREISPGVYWPFREDRVTSDGPEFEFSRMRVKVKQVKTDFDLTKKVASLRFAIRPQVSDSIITAAIHLPQLVEARHFDHFVACRLKTAEG